MSVFLFAFSLALAQQLFQVSRTVPAELEVFDTTVLPDGQLQLEFRDGTQVEGLGFLRRFQIQPPLRQFNDGEAGTRRIFARNATEPPIRLFLSDPCHSAVDANTGQEIGFFVAELHGGNIWWDEQAGRWNDDDREWAGSTCDNERPPLRLMPGQTFTMDIRLKLNEEFQNIEPTSIALEPVVIGGVGPEIQRGGLIITKTEDSDDGLCDADCSLREALAAARSGDTVNIPAGIYTLTLGSELIVDEDLTMLGAGSGDTIIEAAASPIDATSRVFAITAADVSLSDVTIRHGVATHGGGILNTGTLMFTNGSISNNKAANDLGGGIYNEGTLTVIASTVSGNEAGVKGGGVFNGDEATADIVSSTINDNSTGVDGGGTITLTESAISGNTAVNNSGGVFNIAPVAFTTTLINTTVSGNTASLDGGGIFNVGHAKMALTNTTISNNTANFDGGGLQNVNIVDMINSIVSGNAAPSNPDCSAFTSLGHNLIGNVSGCSFNAATGDLTNVDPLLGLLQDNGGDTFTHALLPGSPAIDYIPVENCAVDTDQRGVSRPQGLACDIGAYEVAPIPPPTGMVSWWPGDGNAEDIIDGNDGTLVGGAGFAPGLVGQAFSFDASLDSGVIVPNGANLNMTEAITLDAWIKPSSFPNAYPAVVRRNTNAAASSQYNLAVTDQGEAHCNIGNFVGPVGGTVVLNEWTHLACVYDRVAARVYVNGEEVAAAPATQPSQPARCP